MATIVKPYTFSAGAVIIASEHNSNFDTLYTEFNGNITNINISASAAIVDTKLDQITTAQKVNLSSLVATSQAQGDTIYASDATTFTRLGKNTTATRYLANTGTDNNPNWDLVNFASGGTANIPLKHFAGGTSASTTTYWRGDLSWSGISAAQVFTSSGNFTAPVGITKVYLTMTGGGGGGGGVNGGVKGGGGGGAGQTLINYQYTVISGNVYVVTVGAGGAGGANNADGSDGTASIFDSTVTADFGDKGLSGGNGGTGGVGGGGTLNGTGATAGNFGIQGGNGGVGTTSGTPSGGGGGGSSYGSGVTGTTGNGGNATVNTGAGGAGGGGASGAGGNGATGIVIVMY